MLPTPTGVASAVIARVLSGEENGVETADFQPGMTVKQQIEQVSREDPVYGSIVNSMNNGNAARALYAGRDPYTTYAALKFADWIASLFRSRPKPTAMESGPSNQQNIGRTAQEFLGSSKGLPKDKPNVPTGRMQ